MQLEVSRLHEVHTRKYKQIFLFECHANKVIITHHYCTAAEGNPRFENRENPRINRRNHRWKAQTISMRISQNRHGDPRNEPRSWNPTRKVKYTH